MGELLLGVDGGGSQTRVLLAARDGTVLGRGAAGVSNYQVVGLDAAIVALRDGVARALAEAGIGWSEARVADACFGLAGADRPADVAVLSARIAEWGIVESVAIVNDGELVLAAGTPEGFGIALISGTGSICVGRARDGRAARAGGWGYILGDEGSGYGIALEALRLATQTADGRAGAEAILSAALRQWGLDTPEALIPFAYQSGATRKTFAELIPAILALADEGDPAALRLIERAALELARHVDAVARRLALKRPPLALGGGLLCSSALLRRLCLEGVTVPLGPVALVEEPVYGAIALARRAAAAS